MSARRSEGRHWFLTGFSGAGKSTVGERLASLAGRPFVDLDRAVAASRGLSAGDLVERAGPAALREAEAEELERIPAVPPAVVALGGGTLDGPRARAFVLASGTVAWLDVPVEECVARLRRDLSGERRPILEATLADGGWDALVGLHARRCACYRVASVVVDGTGPPDEVAARVLRLLGGIDEPLS